MQREYAAFAGLRLICTGRIEDVALKTRDWVEQGESDGVLVFERETGRVIDLDLRGTARDVVARLDQHPLLGRARPEKRPGPGRPRLGVVSREISLLPRHWDWLRSEPRSASATLRALVEDAMRVGLAGERANSAEAAVYSLMSVLGGDLPGFEEAARALFAHDYVRLSTMTAGWPGDLHGYLMRLLEGAE